MTVVDYFLKLESRSSINAIKGESKDKDHPGWIELLSFVWTDRPGVGAGAGGGSGRAQRLEEVECTKAADRTSTLLQLASTRAELFTRALIHVPKDKGHWIELRDVRIARCNPVHGMASSRIDSFALNFVGISFGMGTPGPANPARPAPSWDSGALGSLLRHQQRRAALRG